MALIQCYECSKEMDEGEASCPNCGAPKRREVQTWEYMVVGSLSGGMLSGGKAAAFDDVEELDELGKDGWELVSSVVQMGAWNVGVGSSSLGDTTATVWHYLKRPTGTTHL